MAAEPLIHWPEPITEFLGFVGLFLADGAIGLPLRGAARPAHATRRTGSGGCRPRIGARPRHRAPGVGDRAHRRDDHRRAGRARAAGERREPASHRRRAPGRERCRSRSRSPWSRSPPPGSPGPRPATCAAWPLAAFAVIGAALRAIATGSWSRLVNPLHMLAGGLWIGTLFVLVCSALAMSGGLERARRDRWVAARVAAFSPLALGSAAVLATMGVITGWRHLGRIDALWTTPYGATLIVKLMLVACVLALGAWNWRRQRPALGQEARSPRCGTARPSSSRSPRPCWWSRPCSSACRRRTARADPRVFRP